MISIVQLEYIVAVDTYKNFVEAAEHCFVTQPTLSMQIKKLEDDLGVIIFNRNRKPVLTTPIGKEIIQQAKIVISEFKQIKEIIQSQKKEIEGELRIGIIPTLSPYLLPLFLGNFIVQYPQIKLYIEESLSENILKKLNDDELDIGIMVAPDDLKGFKKKVLFYEEFFLYFSSNHPLTSNDEVTLEQLDLDEILILQEGHCFRDQIEQFCGTSFQNNPNNHICFESGSLETLKRIVENQLGYTLLPQLATLDMKEDKKAFLKRFKDKKPLREISLVVSRNYIKMSKVEALENTIKSSIPENLLNPVDKHLITWKYE